MNKRAHLIKDYFFGTTFKTLEKKALCELLHILLHIYIYIYIYNTHVSGIKY